MAPLTFIPTDPLKGAFIEQMTEAEFFQFCMDNRQFKFERSGNGQIIFMSPTTFLTGESKP